MITIHSRKLFLMLAASLGLTAAYALETEQFVYSYSSDNSEARLTGLTEAGKAAEMLIIPAETATGIPVTRITREALRGATCYGITIPNSVRHISDYAFYNCSNLIYLEIPPSVTNAIPTALVYDCPKLGEVAFCLTNETSAVKIGNKCLSYVPALTNVVVRGNGAMTLGDSAFYELASIQVATLQGVAEIEGADAWNTGAFNGCTNLEQVTLIDSPLRNIGSRAFRGCAALESFAIPNTVTNIGNYAFSGCAALKSATLPEGLLSMGLNCFANCTSLGEATLPDSLSETENTYSYSDGYFAGCKSMTNLVIGSGIPVVKKFHLPFDSTNAFTVTVNGSGATVIDYKAFNGTKVGSVVLNGVARIEGTSSSNEGAFYNCTSLTNVVLGAGLAEVGGRAFYNCSALGEIVLPESVETVGNNSFQGTTSLTNIVLQGKTAPDIGVWAFDGTSAVITVPFDGIGYGVENGATGNWANIAAEKVQYSGGAESEYGAWAVSAGLGGKGTAAMMGGYGLDDKVANAFIYAFGDAATNAPLMTISFDANGKPVVTTPQLIRTEGVTLKLLSSADLGDWTSAGESEIKSDSGGNVVAFPSETSSRKFYKLVAE